MGAFKVEISVANWQNRFLPPDKHGEQLSIAALVDTGAAELALPAEIIERLKLEELDRIRVYTADGAEHLYRVMGVVELTVNGRRCHVRVIELPRGAKPLLGALPLEEMDLHISPREKKLVPSPESPDRPLLPLCSKLPRCRPHRRWRRLRPIPLRI